MTNGKTLVAAAKVETARCATSILRHCSQQRSHRPVGHNQENTFVKRRLSSGEICETIETLKTSLLAETM